MATVFMGRARVAVLVGLGSLGLVAGQARAGFVPGPKDLRLSLEAAQVIVVASVVEAPGFTPGPRIAVGRQNPEDLIQMKAFKDAGKYKFRRVQALKGECEDELEIQLPLLSAQHFSQKSFDLPPGTLVLLMLTKTGDKQYTVVDENRALIPLSAAGAVVPLGKAAKADAIDALLGSMGDAGLRQILAEMLEKTEDPRIVPAMQRFGDDPDMRTQAAVLECLARNQDVTAIPKIAKLTVAMEAAHLGSGPTGALSQYRVKEAVPFLNPIVVEGTDLARSNTIRALLRLADQSSVPFLEKAMLKDDSQKLAVRGARETLARLAKEKARGGG